MNNMIKVGLFGLVSVFCADVVQAHTHDYGNWIVDRCAALTGVGVRHHVCKTCGAGERELYKGERRRLKVSILGDSYSTYKGWNPEGASLWYGDPSRSTYNQSDVHDVTNTWWHLLITKLNADLCVNNSYSGAPISDRGYNKEDAQGFSFITRASRLGDSPDLIVVLGATNDAWAGVPMGSDSDSTTTRPINAFIPAVKRMCDEVDLTYPDAQKIAVYNEYLQDYGRMDYVTAMKPIVDSHGWKSCGVNIRSGASNGHPTCVGMRLIEQAVETEFYRHTAWMKLNAPKAVSARREDGRQVEIDLQADEDVADVEVRYTVDGSEPTASSALYSGRFTVSVPFTLRAKAFHPSLDTSDELTLAFGAEVDDPDPDAPAAGDYYVSPSGSDSNAGTSSAAAFATIAKAVSTAAAGSTICLLEGTYELSSEISVDKAITILGAGRDKTTVRPASGKYIRLFTLDAGGKLEALTLTGGRAGPGSAALVKNGTISWCTITANGSDAHEPGGAVCFTGGKGTIDHCIVSGNTASGQGAYGAGIGANGTTGAITIDCCLIVGNKITGNGAGGGIGIKNMNDDLIVRNCTIMDNTGTLYTGGIRRENGYGALTLVNTIVCGNKYGSADGNISVNISIADSKNCFFGLATEAAQVAGSLSGSPALDSAYRPSETSPVVGKGATYTGLGKDLDRNAFATTPAIGCYESVNGEQPPEEPATEDWDHPTSSISAGSKAGEVWTKLAACKLAKANAAKLKAWAQNTNKGNVDFGSAATLGDEAVEAFLLNCANTAAAIASAKAAFTFEGLVPGTIPQSSDFDGKGYNGTVRIEGCSDITTRVWASPTTGDKFFRATLSLE